MAPTFPLAPADAAWHTDKLFLLLLHDMRGGLYLVAQKNLTQQDRT